MRARTCVLARTHVRSCARVAASCSTRLLLRSYSVQVHAMQQAASHAELLASKQGAAVGWQDKHQQLQEASAKEQQQLQQAVAKWRAKAMELQDEVQLSCCSGCAAGVAAWVGWVGWRMLTHATACSSSGVLTCSAASWRCPCRRRHRLQLEARADEALASSQSHAQEAGRLQAALDAATAEAGELQRRLAAVEDERAAAAKRSRSLMSQWESREKGQVQELSTLRCGWSCQHQCSAMRHVHRACKHMGMQARALIVCTHGRCCCQQVAAQRADGCQRRHAARG